MENTKAIRLFSIGLFLSSLIVYLEWPVDNSAFLFQMEYQIFAGGDKQNSFTHPFIALPLCGQILILISAFLSKRKLTLAGMILMSVIVLMILLVGVLSLNFKIIFSALPFIVISVFFILNYKKYKHTT